MQYKYLSEFIQWIKNNPFIDERENVGCSEEEINEVKTLIAPYFKQLPEAIEEDLRYFGKYRFFSEGSYPMLKQALDPDYYNFVEENLKKGFFIMWDGGWGILADDHTNFLPHIKDYETIVQNRDYQNPPFFHWTNYDRYERIPLSSHTYIDKLMKSFHIVRNFDEKIKEYEQMPLYFKYKHDILNVLDCILLIDSDAISETDKLLLKRIEINIHAGIKQGYNLTDTSLKLWLNMDRYKGKDIASTFNLMGLPPEIIADFCPTYYEKKEQLDKSFADMVQAYKN